MHCAEVCPDPRVRVVCGLMHAKVELATDERGGSLVSGTEGTAEAYTTDDSWLWPVTVRLTALSQGGRSIARLKGSLRFAVRVSGQSVEMTDVMTAKDQKHLVAGRQLVVGQVATSKADSQSYSVPVVVNLVDCTQAQFRPAANPNNIRLLDAQGVALAYCGAEGEAGPEQARYTLIFTRRGTGAEQPAKLVWDVPLVTQNIAVPFEFTNLAIP